MIAEFKNTLLRFGLEWFGKYYSVYRGEISDNEDPNLQGRLKIKVPQVYGDDVPNYWAWPRGMFSGDGTGFFAIPNIGDKVWVSFENGDPRFPLWEYGWWLENSYIEESKVNGNKPDNKIFKTKTGHKLEFDDHNALIRLTDSNDNILEMNENGVSIVSDKISLGTLDGSKDKGVYGEKLFDHLNELIDDIGNVSTIVTSTGVTSTINSSPQWTPLATKWKQKFKEFISDKLTLD